MKISSLFLVIAVVMGVGFAACAVDEPPGELAEPPAQELDSIPETSTTNELVQCARLAYCYDHRFNPAYPSFCKLGKGCTDAQARANAGQICRNVCAPTHSCNSYVFYNLGGC